MLIYYLQWETFSHRVYLSFLSDFLKSTIDVFKFFHIVSEIISLVSLPATVLVLEWEKHFPLIFY